MERRSTRARASLKINRPSEDSGSEDGQQSAQKRRRVSSATSASAGHKRTAARSTDAAAEHSSDDEDDGSEDEEMRSPVKSRAKQAKSAASGSSRGQRSESFNSSGAADSATQASSTGALNPDGETELTLPKLDASVLGSGKRWPVAYEAALVRFIAADPELRKWANGDRGSMVEGLQRFSELHNIPDAASMYQRVCRWRAKHRMFVPLLTHAGRTTRIADWTEKADLETLERHMNGKESSWLREWHDTVYLHTLPGSGAPTASASSTASPVRPTRAVPARSAATRSRASIAQAAEAENSSASPPAAPASAPPSAPSNGLSLAARAAMIGMALPPAGFAASGPLSSFPQIEERSPSARPRVSAPSASSRSQASGSGYRGEAQPSGPVQAQLEAQAKEITRLKAEGKQTRADLAEQVRINKQQGKQIEQQASHFEKHTAKLNEQAEKLQDLTHQLDFLYALVRERTGASPEAP